MALAGTWAAFHSRVVTAEYRVGQLEKQGMIHTQTLKELSNDIRHELECIKVTLARIEGRLNYEVTRDVPRKNRD